MHIMSNMYSYKYKITPLVIHLSVSMMNTWIIIIIIINPSANQVRSTYCQYMTRRGQFWRITTTVQVNVLIHNKDQFVLIDSLYCCYKHGVYLSLWIIVKSPLASHIGSMSMRMLECWCELAFTVLRVVWGSEMIWSCCGSADLSRGFMHRMCPLSLHDRTWSWRTPDPESENKHTHVTYSIFWRHIGVCVFWWYSYTREMCMWKLCVNNPNRRLIPVLEPNTEQKSKEPPDFHAASPLPAHSMAVNTQMHISCFCM